MKIADILFKTGKIALKTAFPAAGGVIDLVNGFFGDDEKLPADATGEEVQAAINKLPPEAQGEIALKNIDVEIAEIDSWVKRQQILNDADTKGASTRPEIAMIMAWLIVGIDSLCMVALGFATYQGDIDIATAWPMAAVLLGLPTTLLKSYFSLRSSDKEARIASSTGQLLPAKGLAALMSVFKGKK